MRHAWYLVFLCLIVTIALAIMIMCKKNFAKRRPQNIICLAVFTICEAYIVAWFASSFEPTSALVAACLALVLTLGLSIYAWVTEADFTLCRGLMVGFIVVIIFFAIAVALNAANFVNMILVFIIIMLYCLFIVYDT